MNTEIGTAAAIATAKQYIPAPAAIAAATTISGLFGHAAEVLILSLFLLVGGLGASLAQAAFAPEDRLGRRYWRTLASVFGAICLGGPAAFWLEGRGVFAIASGEGLFWLMAVGFFAALAVEEIVARGVRQAIREILQRILGGAK